MKQLSLFIMAALLMIGLAQCKKDTNQNAVVGEKVSITLKVADGSKADIDPEVSGKVSFEDGDQVLVAYNGKYVGALTYANGVFANDELIISEAPDAQPLYFYFLGNRQGDIAVNATSCTVSIADQSGSYAVLSYGASSENYTGGGTYYTFFRNQSGLVRFNLATAIPSTIPVSVTGMNNSVTVDFGSQTFTPSMVGDGSITLKAESETARWAILPIQDAVSNATATAVGYEASAEFTVPAIYANAYIKDVNVLEMADCGCVSSYFVPKAFSVADGVTVEFSQGNLQYLASDDMWRFATCQWNFVGNAIYGNVYEDGVKCNNENIDQYYDGWIDLFAWGTSGYDHGAFAYQPWSFGTRNEDYYAYGGANNNLYDQTGQADWGYNAISNGGNAENSGWRTLTSDEWNYVFSGRPEAASKYGHGKVGNVNGMIILPDEWTQPVGVPSFTPGSSQWANVYNVQQWSLMEAAGAVFLPAAGQRYMDTFDYTFSNGYYWSASSNYFNDAPSLYFDDRSLLELPSSIATMSRYRGLSVRLVRNLSGGNTPTPSDGKFTINDNGDKVKFAPGNLQYIGSAGNGDANNTGAYWKFADNQWEYLGLTTGQNGVGANIDRDLFCWGTSGYHDAGDQYNTQYFPWSTSAAQQVNTTYNYFGYGPSTNMASPDLTGTSANYDWGVYNAIYNPSTGNTDPAGTWRTLTSEEWVYVFNTRDTPSDIRYAKAYVSTVPGVILLPDGWDAATYPLTSTNTAGADYTTNAISLNDWQVLESAGAVFLPAAGFLNWPTVGAAGSQGDYWSASHYSSNYAYHVHFSSGNLDEAYGNFRFYGFSVRLVQDAN